MKKGLAVILSGPSGAGKSTITHLVNGMWPGLLFSVSCTTRDPRPGETDGVDYHFCTPEHFAELRDQGEFLEYAEVHDHSYGTPKRPVIDAIDHGQIMLLDIDVQGARKVRAALSGTPYAPSVLTAFVTPPSLAVLEERLRNRHTETEESLQRRLHNAALEMACWRDYQYLLVNDQAEVAAQDLLAIIRAATRQTALMSEME